MIPQKLFVIPEYRCPECGELYTSRLEYKDKSVFFKHAQNPSSPISELENCSEKMTNFRVDWSELSCFVD